MHLARRNPTSIDHFERRFSGHYPRVPAGRPYCPSNRPTKIRHAKIQNITSNPRQPPPKSKERILGEASISPVYNCAMVKTQTRFVCQNCGRSVPRQLGRCPSCGEYGTMVEEVIQEKVPRAF